MNWISNLWGGDDQNERGQPRGRDGQNGDVPPVSLSSRVENLLRDDLISTQTAEEDVKLLQIPTCFNWAHGGRKVYLVTSLDDWQVKHMMTRSQTDFSRILELPTGRKIQYRFEVDGRLLCDPEQKHVRGHDGGYVNEIYVESTSHESFVYQKQSTGKFTQDMPDPDAYVREPPHAPAHLRHIILNSLPPKGSNPVLLPQASHVVLGHVFIAERKSHDVVVLGMTQRFQSKTFTTVYYKHVNKLGTEDKMESEQMPNQNPAKASKNFFANFL